MTYTLLVLGAGMLAKGRATGRQGALRAGIAIGIMLAPQAGTGVYVLMLSPDHTGSAVEVATLGHRIQMRAAGEKRQIRFAACERHHQIGAGIACRLKTELTRLGFHNVERSGFTPAIALAGDADAVERCGTKRIEQLTRQRTILRIVNEDVAALSHFRRHVGGLSQARSWSSASSITTP